MYLHSGLFFLAIRQSWTDGTVQPCGARALLFLFAVGSITGHCATLSLFKGLKTRIKWGCFREQLPGKNKLQTTSLQLRTSITNLPAVCQAIE